MWQFSTIIMIVAFLVFTIGFIMAFTPNYTSTNVFLMVVGFFTFLITGWLRIINDCDKKIIEAINAEFKRMQKNNNI